MSLVVFFFISLKQVDDGGFNFLTPDGIKLKIDRSTYSLRTIKFNGSDGVALAKKDEDNKNILNQPITRKIITNGLSLLLNLKSFMLRK